MDDYIAAIAGVQLTVAGGLLGVLLGDYWWLLGLPSILFGSMVVATVAYDDLRSR